MLHLLGCARPLGLDKNVNQDIRTTSPASSVHRPSAARLNGPSALCPRPSGRPHHLQIDLSKTYKLTVIAIQGGTGQNTWVKFYRISFMAGATLVTYSESGSTKVRATWHSK